MDTFVNQTDGGLRHIIWNSHVQISPDTACILLTVLIGALVIIAFWDLITILDKRTKR